MAQRHFRSQSTLGGQVAAHPVDSASGRRGRRADVVAGQRDRVQAGRGAEKHLPEIVQAAADVAADKIGIAGFQLWSREHRARQNQLVEAGSKALDLRFHRIGHGSFASIGNVTVGPGRVTSQWSARGIEKTRLRQQHIRFARKRPAPDLGFAARNLLEGSTQVYRARASAIGREPWDRSRQRPIHFASPRPITEARQSPLVRAWNGVSENT